jgi:hypothetical protein
MRRNGAGDNFSADLNGHPLRIDRISEIDGEAGRFTVK